MQTPSHFIRNFALVALLFSSQLAFSQGAKWSVNGNATSTGDFVGTTNSNWLFFRTANIQRMSLSTTGVLQINSLIGTGTAFTSLDANGNLMRTNFPNDPNQVLTGAGTFSSISNLSGWKIVGNNMYNINSGFVGIGTSSPGYPLDIMGNMRVNGILYAQGLVLATKVQADTMKSTSMISVNNNLSFYSGLVNDIYTTSGDVRLQSRIGFSGNTILNAGNNGNVGIGVYSPQYKLDVDGTMRVNGTITATGLNILQLNADSMKSASMISVNNNLKLTGGFSSEIYTQTGDMLLQSRYGSNGNTILNAGTNGNVGIGVYSPQYKFDVEGDARVSGKIYTNRIVPLPGDSLIRFGDSTIFVNTSVNQITTDPFVYQNLLIGGISVGWGYHGYAFGYQSLAFGTQVRTSLSAINSIVIGSGMAPSHVHPYFLENTIPNSLMIGFNSTLPTLFVGPPSVPGATGGVCIGDTYIPDGYKLAVNGKIIAEEVQVKLRGFWPDTVFSSTYNLMPLPDLATYVNREHHLPGVPSAQQVQKQQSFGVGEMEVTLLQKTEEQTLYIIALQKQIDAMQMEMDAMKKEFEEMRKK